MRSCRFPQVFPFICNALRTCGSRHPHFSKFLLFSFFHAMFVSSKQQNCGCSFFQLSRSFGGSLPQVCAGTFPDLSCIFLRFRCLL